MYVVYSLIGCYTYCFLTFLSPLFHWGQGWSFYFCLLNLLPDFWWYMFSLAGSLALFHLLRTHQAVFCKQPPHFTLPPAVSDGSDFSTSSAGVLLWAICAGWGGRDRGLRPQGGFSPHGYEVCAATLHISRRLSCGSWNRTVPSLELNCPSEALSYVWSWSPMVANGHELHAE